MANVQPSDNNGTTENEDSRATAWVLDLTWDDANWILTASFIIFTMQTGNYN
jgi:hypothetical protein